ncbi:sce7725 family protein [Stenotrophomonas maltophilia]|uniref:sce7725 family protein n=1 Tax=Stenotrophomonas maltophilia TaxID=40324 RepID=UPI0028949FF8|nr:sce7725 family protein [Stenotrophomonas maltophilia]MDT3486128.1 sce7725 family protein [Stenotrophomonas maltophilia]
MSYHPYFRGKQYELICVKENAELLARSGFCPIIEPVKNDVGSMLRCLSEIKANGGQAFVVANPGCGALKGGLENEFKDRISEIVENSEGLSWIYRAQGVEEKSIELSADRSALLHDRSVDASKIRAIADSAGVKFDPNVFIDTKDSGPLYRRNFRAGSRILIRDGFRKKKNSEYLDPDVEHFSDLHITFEDEGMQGFGDFLTVGDEYSEGGGPAYAVAIHLTFVDEESDSSMFIRHFVSDSNLTPADPAGKFSEALGKLATAVRRKNSKIPKTKAVLEFLDLHDRGHYPGLGYVKKLSMQHHIELMASVLHG